MKKYRNMLFPVAALCLVMAGCSGASPSHPASLPQTTPGNVMASPGSPGQPTDQPETLKSEAASTRSSSASPAAPVPTTAPSANARTAAPQGAGSGDPANVQSAEPASSVQPPETPAPAASGQVTVEQLRTKCESQLEQLKNADMAQLQALYNQAAADRKSGLSADAIFTKYEQQAMDLQENSQAKANQILLQFKTELLQNGLPVNSVSELRTAYNTEVAQEEQALSVQAKSRLGLAK